MFRDLHLIPLGRIALHGFFLNMIWEFGQCTVFYDMWNWGVWRGALWMWGAIFGDVLIVLAVALLSCLLVGPSNLRPLSGLGWTALLSVGLGAGIFLEWLAQVLELWSYSDWMPTVEVFGHPTGLLPILQITGLPACAVRLAVGRPNLGLGSES